MDTFCDIAFFGPLPVYNRGRHPWPTDGFEAAEIEFTNKILLKNKEWSSLSEVEASIACFFFFWSALRFIKGEIN